jgi:hypothetical protein
LDGPITATWYCLCIDTHGPGLGEFWAGAMGGTFRPDDDPDGFDEIHGPDGMVAVMVPVPEAKTAKHRVHLDLRAGSLADVTDLGARVTHPQEETGFPWTVLEDPQGGEFCVFLKDEPPAFRLYDVVVDCKDPETSAHWWAERFGVEVGNDPSNPWYWIDEVPGMPFENLVFVPVPEPKTVKNRIHWDLRGEVAEFQEAGARVLWEGRSWITMADPEGNEFCVFPRAE